MIAKNFYPPLTESDHRMSVCHICGKLVDPEWHDHADEISTFED